MGQRAESVEEHRGELYDQYQREEEDEYETDRLQLQILLRDVYLQNRDVCRTHRKRNEMLFLGSNARWRSKSKENKHLLI